MYLYLDSRRDPVDVQVKRVLYLLRHADTGLTETFVGHWDVPATEQGRRDTVQLAQNLKRLKVDALYCSDLLRARQTAESMAGLLTLEPELMPGLRERDVGQWQGLRWDQITKEYPQEAKEYLRNWSSAIQGGESLSDMQRRVLAAWERIWSRNWKRAIVIAHAGTNRILLAEFLGIPDENLFRIAQDFLGINCVEFVENTPTVQTINARFSS